MKFSFRELVLKYRYFAIGYPLSMQMLQDSFPPVFYITLNISTNESDLWWSLLRRTVWYVQAVAELQLFGQKSQYFCT